MAYLNGYVHLNDYERHHHPQPLTIFITLKNLVQRFMMVNTFVLVAGNIIGMAHPP